MKRCSVCKRTATGECRGCGKSVCNYHLVNRKCPVCLKIRGQ